MNTLKNFAQMSTDMFVRFNEKVAERMKDLKIDDKYTDELMGAVHHVRDKNNFYVELASFWNIAHKEWSEEDPASSNETLMEALRTLKENTQKIYSRKAESKHSKMVDWLSDVERFSDEMAVKFLEMGARYSHTKKNAFDAVAKFAEEFQQLEEGHNREDYEAFNSIWDKFQSQFLQEQ